MKPARLKYTHYNHSKSLQGEISFVYVYTEIKRERTNNSFSYTYVILISIECIKLVILKGIRQGGLLM